MNGILVLRMKSRFDKRLIMWNPGQKQFIGKAFIPENKKPQSFKNITLPCTFCFEGNAYRRFSINQAFRLDSMQKVDFNGDELVHPQTNKKPIYQDAH